MLVADVANLRKKKRTGNGNWLVAATVSLLFSCVAMQVYFGCSAVSCASRSCIVWRIYTVY